MSDRIEEIRAMFEKATKGPWAATDTGGLKGKDDEVMGDFWCSTDANNAFIEHTWANTEYLLRRLAAAERYIAASEARRDRTMPRTYEIVMAAMEREDAAMKDWLAAKGAP